MKDKVGLNAGIRITNGNYDKNHEIRFTVDFEADVIDEMAYNEASEKFGAKGVVRNAVSSCWDEIFISLYEGGMSPSEAVNPSDALWEKVKELSNKELKDKGLMITDLKAFDWRLSEAAMQDNASLKRTPKGGLFYLVCGFNNLIEFKKLLNKDSEIRASFGI